MTYFNYFSYVSTVLFYFVVGIMIFKKVLLWRAARTYQKFLDAEDQGARPKDWRPFFIEEWKQPVYAKNYKEARKKHNLRIKLNLKNK